jgi:hypothetical protein
MPACSQERNCTLPPDAAQTAALLIATIVSRPSRPSAPHNPTRRLAVSSSWLMSKDYVRSYVLTRGQRLLGAALKVLSEDCAASARLNRRRRLVSFALVVLKIACWLCLGTAGIALIIVSADGSEEGHFGETMLLVCGVAAVICIPLFLITALMLRATADWRQQGSQGESNAPMKSERDGRRT